MIKLKQKKNYEIDMCNGPILSKMLMFAIPLMCSSMLQMLFNGKRIVSGRSPNKTGILARDARHASILL